MSNATGIVSGADIASVLVTCITPSIPPPSTPPSPQPPAWGTAAAIGSTGTHTFGPYSLGTDSIGHARLIYGLANGSNYNKWTKSYVPGSGWTTPVDTGIAAFGQFALGSLVANGNGNTVAVWREYIGGMYQIYATYYTPNAGWSLSSRISDTTSGFLADQPYVAIVRAGMLWPYDNSASASATGTTSTPAGIRLAADGRPRSCSTAGRERASTTRDPRGCLRRERVCHGALDREYGPLFLDAVTVLRCFHWLEQHQGLRE